MSEKWKNSKVIFKGNVFSVKSGTVSLDNNAETTRDIIEHPGGVVVLPILDGKIILIRQFRISLNKEIYELPGGRLQRYDSIEDRAHSELKEETGYKANSLTNLISYYPVPGITNLKIHIFKATNLEFCGSDLEWDERIDVVSLSRDDVNKMLSRGTIVDGSTLIALNLY